MIGLICPAIATALPECLEVETGLRLCRLCRTAQAAERAPEQRFWILGPWRNQVEADRALACLEGVVGLGAASVRSRSEGYELLVPAHGEVTPPAAFSACASGFSPFGPESVAPFDLPGTQAELELIWLEIDLRRFRVEARHGRDHAIGLEPTRQLALRHGAVAAVNGGFFATSGTLRGDSTGLWIHRQRLLSEPDRGRGAVGFEERSGFQRVHFGRPQAEIWWEFGTRRLPVSGINRNRRAGEIVLYTPEFHRTTLTEPGGIEIVVRSGRIVETAHPVGSREIPHDGFVVSLAPDVKVAGIRPGTPSRWGSSIWGWLDEPKDVVAEAVSAGPWLLASGRSVLDPSREAISQVFSRARHPRTAVGARHDGLLLLVVADGRAPGRSAGVSLPELQELLLELGVTDAVNLDGGGSSTLVLFGRVVNEPSDRTGERENGDGLLVFRRHLKREETLESDQSSLREN